MRRTFMAAFAVFLTFITATTASAQVNGTRQDLVFVASTSLTGAADEPLALCHLVEHRVALFVPIFTSMESYALAANDCDTDSFYDINEVMFIAEQANGGIPSDLPSQPKLGTGTIAKNYIVGGIGGIILLFVVISFIRRKYREVMG